MLRVLFVRLGEVAADPAAAAWVLPVELGWITGRSQGCAADAARRGRPLPVPQRTYRPSMLMCS
jgi:hypothetical protein